MTTTPVRTRFALALAALALVFAACGGDDDDTAADDATTTTAEDEATTTTEADEPDVTSTVPADDPDEGDLADARLAADPSAGFIGDKLILLDGFFGIRLPDRWGVTDATPLARSVSPAGGETELDVDALQQALVLNPLADERAATLSLLHYTHSDSVPDLDVFTTAIVDLLSGDGSVIGEGQTITIGGQDGRLHQVTSASGTGGLMATIQAGDEYFFLLSLVSDDEYLTEASEMLSSISMVPEAIR